MLSCPTPVPLDTHSKVSVGPCRPRSVCCQERTHVNPTKASTCGLLESQPTTLSTQAKTFIRSTSHPYAGNTAYPGRPRTILGPAGAGSPCSIWPSSSHIVLFSSSVQGLPACPIPGRITHHTASNSIDLDMHAAQDNTGASAPAFHSQDRRTGRRVCILHYIILPPIPIRLPARPCYTMYALGSVRPCSSRRRRRQ